MPLSWTAALPQQRRAAMRRYARTIERHGANRDRQLQALVKANDVKPFDWGDFGAKLLLGSMWLSIFGLLLLYTYAAVVCDA